MTYDELRAVLQETLGAPSGARSSVAWQGYQGPLGGAQPLAPSGPGQSFPFRTQTAEVLWKYIQDLMPRFPALLDDALIKKAIETSGVSPLDLSPEDWRLLEMAVEWRRNGLKGVKYPRIGGAPGGPFDPREYGHHLSKRGAP